ncbi:Tcc44h21-2.7 [Trypanosoma grayi]|uniref:Tcc44h21-2.7 n=1 Tax=Trypanosoma grayi TaxID=71804 RepID=UPI0004F484DC|nr:Tcc44h21-2.7 [Trypanosoma grayi]KEG09211.1 Tcc44h21-2.7 [Trypanosoma grayi]
MHDLESRVQYVNPWVVQYMWELLCELRDKIGVQYSQQRERVWLEEMRSSGRCRRGVQPMTEPRMAGCSAQHETAAAIVSVPATPMRLFDGSADGCHDGGGDDLDTSVSSESDNGDESSFGGDER